MVFPSFGIKHDIFTLQLTPPIVKLRGIPTVFGSGYHPVHLTLYSLPTCFAVHDSFVIGPVNTHKMVKLNALD